jgi:hypothetical protein
VAWGVGGPGGAGGGGGGGGGGGLLGGGGGGGGGGGCGEDRRWKWTRGSSGLPRYEQLLPPARLGCAVVGALDAHAKPARGNGSNGEIEAVSAAWPWCSVVTVVHASCDLQCDWLRVPGPQQLHLGRPHVTVAVACNRRAERAAEASRGNASGRDEEDRGRV